MENFMKEPQTLLIETIILASPLIVLIAVNESALYL